MTPCNECIVDSMCQNVCDNLTSYISILIKIEVPLSLYYCRIIAYWIRVSKSSKEIGEVQIYMTRIIIDRDLLKQPNFIIRKGELCDILYSPIPIRLPTRKGFRYYKTLLLERIVYVEFKDIIDRSDYIKYYRDFNGEWQCFTLIY